MDTRCEELKNYKSLQVIMEIDKSETNNYVEALLCNTFVLFTSNEHKIVAIAYLI